MVIINRVLCPVDFSEFSRHALARAIAIAKDHGAAVTAVHVVPLGGPVFTGGLDVVGPIVPLLVPEERDGLLRTLAAFVRAQAPGDVPLDFDVVEAPSIHGEILAQATRLHADLIVLGTHGRSGFQHLVFGSVTEKVLRIARQPVITVGLPATDTSETPGSFTRILCAVDFSECSIAALRYALSLAEGARARVTVLTVLEWPPLGYDPLVGVTDFAGFHAAVERAAGEHLHKVIGDFSPKGLEIVEVTRSGKPHHEILRLATEQRADLIVLGIHGKNPVDRLLFGATAEPVVRRASCPVLTVRSDVMAKVAAA
jgi:nucleotide-binding universal stress UspA family protein